MADLVVGIREAKSAVAHVTFSLVAVDLVTNVLVTPPKVPVRVCANVASCSVKETAFAVPMVNDEGTVAEAVGAESVAVYVLVPMLAVPLYVVRV